MLRYDLGGAALRKLDALRASGPLEAFTCDQGGSRRSAFNTHKRPMADMLPLVGLAAFGMTVYNEVAEEILSGVVFALYCTQYV